MTAGTGRISRRAATMGLAAAGAATVVPATGRARGSSTPPVPAKTWLLARDAPPLRVPRDFLGLHSDHGIHAGLPRPTYAYDAVRSHDATDARTYPVLQWAMIERAPGIYDWAAVDAWIAAHPGTTRIFVLFGCPSFYQKYPGEPWLYPYLPGGGSPPRDPAVAARFVATLLARHPGRIDFIEIWNEPNFGWDGRDPVRDRWRQAKPGFFTGTGADLAALARAVKAVLPTGVKLMAGAWEGQDAATSDVNSLLRFSNAPDGAGGRGRDHVDALSVHAYTYRHDPNALAGVLTNYRARFKQAGYSAHLGCYVTEIGAEAPGIWTHATPPIDQKLRTIARWAMIPAALGWLGVYLYKHSAMRTLGDPAATPAVASAIGAIRNRIVGRTITAAAILEDDTVWLAFADGEQHRA